MIKQINNKIDANKCDTLLTKLILDERKYDNTISEEIQIKNYFPNLIYNKNYILIGYYQNDEIVGYILIKKISDIDCLLDGLYVEEEYRNKGIGTSLIKEAIKIIKTKNYKYVDIGVMSNNKNALNLYKKIGFKDLKITLRKEL